MRTGPAFVLLTLLAISLPRLGDANPSLQWSPFKALYAIGRSNLTVGETTLTLDKPAQGHYRYSAITRPVGIARWFTKGHTQEESEGRLTPTGVLPERYLFIRNSSDPRQERIEFDWTRSQARGESDGKSWQHPLQQGLQDGIAYQLEVMRAFACGARQLDLEVADGHSSDHYHFELLGKETVKTPAGRFKALKIIRAKEGEKPNYTFWLAPEAGYLPVRIYRHDKNVAMALKKLKGRPLN